MLWPMWLNVSLQITQTRPGYYQPDAFPSRVASDLSKTWKVGASGPSIGSHALQALHREGSEFFPRQEPHFTKKPFIVGSSGEQLAYPQESPFSPRPLQQTQEQMSCNGSSGPWNRCLERMCNGQNRNNRQQSTSKPPAPEKGMDGTYSTAKPHVCATPRCQV